MKTDDLIQMKKIEERVASNKVFTGIDQVTKIFWDRKCSKMLERLTTMVFLEWSNF